MFWTLFILACHGPEEQAAPQPQPPVTAEIIGLIDPHRMKAHVDVLADDSLGGRVPGSQGSSDARDYILGEMIEIGLEPLGDDGGYVFSYPNSGWPGRKKIDQNGNVVDALSDTGYNLVGLLPGSDPALADEYMVVMAHYDHLGVDSGGDVFNGAFDNAAAVAMNLELARVMLEHDAVPGRSTVFLFTDDEEAGLDGAEMWINAPTVPADKIVCGVSTDPLGRASLPDFAPIVLIGSERSPALKARWQEAASFLKSPVYFIHRDVIPVFSSDQDEFYTAELPVPALWFTNIGFSWYHTTGDTAETIDYRIMLQDAELLMYALAIIGSEDARYDYEGTFQPAGAEAQEAKRLITDLLKSDYPSAADKDFADFFLDQLDLVIEQDSEEALDDATITYTGTLYFLLFDLPTKYPGEVPPPWPEGW
ncbi:MAG: M28 family peptidase [Rhodobacterales bacterium]|nr:M28 family peptidase [Rhodobacterales bacterium]